MEHKARAFAEALGLTLICFVALIPAAVLTIAGNVVFYLRNRSQGAIRIRTVGAKNNDILE